VRSAVPDDVRAIQDLWREILVEDTWFMETVEEDRVDLAAARTLLKSLLADSNSHAWVAELRGLVIGVARLIGGQLGRTRHVASFEIFLAEDVRGLGLGRRMLEELVEFSEKNRWLRRLELNVFSDNDHAIRLYQALGFEHEGTRRAAIREADGRNRDTLCMVRWV
jgi:RimJ/RimL family protein N-acetyltransferase